LYTSCMKEKTESPNKYLIITIEEPPHYEMQGEEFLKSKIIKRSPIYHNWVKNENAEIIGIKISSWMISTLKLSRKEKELITEWGKLDSDLEVYFGNHNTGNKSSISDDIVSFTTMLQLDFSRFGISFPLFGEATDKKEMGKLELNLIKWKDEQVRHVTTSK